MRYHPLLWGYAQKFVIYDHIFQSLVGPSTPGNLAIIGAQSGQTQWVKHPTACSGPVVTGDNCTVASISSGPGVPVPNDDDPFWGSQADKTTGSGRMPVAVRRA